MLKSKGLRRLLLVITAGWLLIWGTILPYEYRELKTAKSNLALWEKTTKSLPDLDEKYFSQGVETVYRDQQAFERDLIIAFGTPLLGFLIGRWIWRGFKEDHMKKEPLE